MNVLLIPLVHTPRMIAIISAHSVPIFTQHTFQARIFSRLARALKPVRPRHLTLDTLFLLKNSSRFTANNMSSDRDVSSQTDISKMKTEEDGSFKRKPSTFRNTIEKGGKFEPERDRYHLYVSYACRECAFCW